MATAYPTTLDTSTQQPSPSASTEMDDAGFLHDEVHTNASGALIALETKLGVGATTAATASTNHVLVKQGDGDTEWAAVPAAVPTTITVADTTNTTCSVALFESETGDLAPKTDAALDYNAATGVLAATGFSGPLTGNVTGNASGTSGSTTGNAATATALATSRTIGGTSFDGTGNITPANATLAATATALATARDIGGVSFDGTGNITLPGVNSTGNQNTSGTAATVTGAAQTNITSVGTLSALAVTGAVTAGSVVAPLVIVDEDNTHSFNAADAGKMFTFSGSSGATTITLPQDSATTFAEGTQIMWVRYHTSNAVTFAAGTGATVISKDSNLSIDGQYAVAVTVKSDANEWLIFGALA